MRYLLMFYADEAEWMALPESERNAAIGRIGEWYGMQVKAGKIVDGTRLAGGKRATTTVRLGRIQRSGDAPVVGGGPLGEAKEAAGAAGSLIVRSSPWGSRSRTRLARVSSVSRRSQRMAPSSWTLQRISSAWGASIAGAAVGTRSGSARYAASWPWACSTIDRNC